MTDKPTPTDTPPPCDQELFDQGVSVGLFDIPKWTAEALCRGIAAATEARVDWHYIGGRVHIKALPAARAQADSVQEDAAREAIEKVLALFPFNVPTQKFTVNNGPCLTADNDDEFYSVKRVLAFLTEIKTTLDAARKQGENHDR